MDNVATIQPIQKEFMPAYHDAFGTRKTLSIGGRRLEYWSLEAAESKGLIGASRLPLCLRVLLENVLRNDDGVSGGSSDLSGLASWLERGTSDQEISFYPARVLMPDSSGVPLVADLAAMRDAVRDQGGEPTRVNPHIPVDIVIDHSVAVDVAGRADAYDINLRLEYERNSERYAFLKWAQNSFKNFRVVPPAMGIVHQINLEYLARVVWETESDGRRVVYPDTLVGMDSHTAMINGLGVIGWGVGGIEAGAAMLGQPISMLIPEIVGCRVLGRMRPGVTCTDVVLSLTQKLRQFGVVGKFVEFFGEGLDHLPLAHRATLANMTPEMGATVSFFPIDAETIRYLALTGRAPEQVALVEAYAKQQGLWRETDVSNIVFTDVVEFDLADIEPSMAGPRRPQDRIGLSQVPQCFRDSYAQRLADPQAAAKSKSGELHHGDVVIAAITSCTNTSNPEAMVGAGLLAKKLLARGLRAKPWVKASLAPGSRVVTEYLKSAGLQEPLDALGFHLVGYGCMTCAGASGPLADEVASAIESQDLVVATVLSGNRNFEGRTHPLAQANFLASPALVVAYAVGGTVLLDVTTEPLGSDSDGKPVYLRDVWPSDREIEETINTVITPHLFSRTYASVFEGNSLWRKLPASSNTNYEWDPESTYIKRPPFLEPAGDGQSGNITEARVLLMLGDSITTDHISPVGGIKPESPAGRYLAAKGVAISEFNSLLARRANHDVMIRGTFANIRLRNELADGREGGITRRMPDGPLKSVFETAMDYAREKKPLVVVAGAEYGTGSSRDWAAKGTRLLGVRAVIAESFERIHRSNLVAMGVLPLQFPEGVTRKTLGLTGNETFTVTGLDGELAPRMHLPCAIRHPDGSVRTVSLLCRLDIPREIEWYRQGGILPYVFNHLMTERSAA